MSQLPPIPERLYFNIREVADLCNLKTHVLRYWEQEFPQLRNIKRRGNRRFYQRKDVLLIRHIQHLLYNDGFTIEGARAKLNKSTQSAEVVTLKSKSLLQRLLSGLEQILIELEEEAA